MMFIFTFTSLLPISRPVLSLTSAWKVNCLGICGAGCAIIVTTLNITATKKNNRLLILLLLFCFYLIFTIL